MASQIERPTQCGVEQRLVADTGGASVFRQLHLMHGKLATNH